MLSRPITTTFALCTLAAALFACSGGSAEIADPEMAPQNPVTVQTAGLEVQATLASVTLGDDCGSSAAKSGAPAADSAGICAAPLPDAGTSTGCGGTGGCTQTNMQLKLTATGVGAAAKIEIVSVRLTEVASGAEVDQLKAREPQSWDSVKYSAWDQTVAPGASLNVSYKLSAPNWSRSTGQAWDSYKSRYYLEVVIRIDQTTRTLRSQELSRAALVAT